MDGFEAGGDGRTGRCDEHFWAQAKGGVGDRAGDVRGAWPVGGVEDARDGGGTGGQAEKKRWRTS